MGQWPFHLAWNGDSKYILGLLKILRITMKNCQKVAKIA